VNKSLSIWENKDLADRQKINLIITMGGDGTICWAAKQFSGIYQPPMICFAQGSLGFMTNFSFSEYKDILQNYVSNNGLGIDERMRLKINMGQDDNKDRCIFRGDQLDSCDSTLIQDFHVINEVVFDRGPSPYSIQLEVFVNDIPLTTCVGDGIILSTPTGSTAYSMSAGGSIVQTNTDSICLTPLAPHSLSFRPIILPKSSRIRVQKKVDGRGCAWVSLDGATRFKLD
jgi:NAD+ kinase